MKKIFTVLLLFSLATSFAQSLSYTSTNFGEVGLNNVGTLTFSIKNNTSNTFTVSSVVSVVSRPANNPPMCPPVSVAHFALSSGINAQQNVASGETATFVVEFAPQSYTTSGTINMGPSLPGNPTNMIMCNPSSQTIRSGLGIYSGGFSVTVTANGSQINAESVNISGVGVDPSTLSSEDTEFANKLLYPNPTNNVLNVSKDINLIILKDVTGITVLESANAGILDISNLPAGIYYAELRKAGSAVTLKVVKN